MDLKDCNVRAEIDIEFKVLTELEHPNIVCLYDAVWQPEFCNRNFLSFLEQQIGIRTNVCVIFENFIIWEPKNFKVKK